MKLFSTLGFFWDVASMPQTIPTNPPEAVLFRFKSNIPQIVWNASSLESNPFTFREVETLVHGTSVGGRKLIDQTQVLNLIEAHRYLLHLVSKHRFLVDKKTITTIQSFLAQNGPLEHGHFRGEGREHVFTPSFLVGKKMRYSPSATVPGAIALNRCFFQGVADLENSELNPLVKAMAFFVFIVFRQFFFSANRRAANLFMNGILLSHGIDAISVPVHRIADFSGKLERFFQTKDATELMLFLVECHPSAVRISAMNPHVSDAELRPVAMPTLRDIRHSEPLASAWAPI